VRKPGGDAKQARVFVVVSRSALIASRFSTVICAPVYSQRHGLGSEVEVDSLPKASLSDYVGSLSNDKLGDLDRALRVALELD
jgi:mRNA interferase MazF